MFEEQDICLILIDIIIFFELVTLKVIDKTKISWTYDLKGEACASSYLKSFLFNLNILGEAQVLSSLTNFKKNDI